MITCKEDLSSSLRGKRDCVCGKIISPPPPQSIQMNMKLFVVLCSLNSDRRGRELHHRTTIRPQPESRLSGDTGLREQPGGEDGGDVLCESQLLMN